LSKLNVEGKATIKNRFTFEVEHIDTGKVETYKAEYIVLDKCFSRLVNFDPYFTHIHVGTGTGTLDPTRTSLFNFSGQKSASTVLTERALPTSRWQRQIVLNPEEYVGEELSEVGIAYGTSSTSLCTHALIEDSEGNPISLIKTDTMVVTIYADIFIGLGELTAMYGGKWRWVQPLANNQLLSYLLGSTYPTQQFRVTGLSDFYQGGTANSSHGSSSSITTGDWTKDASNKKVTTPVKRLGTSTGNGAIRGFGLGSSDTSGTFRGQLPIPDVFTGHNIEGEQIGVGDGEQDSFNFAFNPAVDASVTVYIDDVEQETGLTVNELVNYVGTALSGFSVASTGWDCSFSPDGSLLAVAHSGDNYITVFDTETWDTVGSPSVAGRGWGCSFSPDGTLLAVAHSSGNYITVFDTSDWSTVGSPSVAGRSRDCSFSPYGSLLAVAHYEGNRITVFDTSDWSTVGSPSVAGTGRGCSFSPDGSLLAVAHSYGNYITVFDTSNWSTVGSPSVAGTGYGCSFSPDGSLLAVAHYDGNQITVFDTSDWSTVGSPSVAGTGYGCPFSPDGSLLAVAHSSGNQITVFDTSDWSTVGSPSVAGRGHGCSFSPDGSLLAVAHHSGNGITVFDGKYNAGESRNVIFDTPPADSEIITADYSVDFIPKDSDHVLDLQCGIQYGEG